MAPICHLNIKPSFLDIKEQIRELQTLGAIFILSWQSSSRSEPFKSGYTTFSRPQGRAGSPVAQETGEQCCWLRRQECGWCDTSLAWQHARGGRLCLVLGHYGLFRVLVRSWYSSRMYRSRKSPGPKKQKVWFYSLCFALITCVLSPFSLFEPQCLYL